jgi:hypothetical protein
MRDHLFATQFPWQLRDQFSSFLLHYLYTAVGVLMWGALSDER